ERGGRTRRRVGAQRLGDAAQRLAVVARRDRTPGLVAAGAAMAQLGGGLSDPLDRAGREPALVRHREQLVLDRGAPAVDDEDALLAARARLRPGPGRVSLRLRHGSPTLPESARRGERESARRAAWREAGRAAMLGARRSPRMPSTRKPALRGRRLAAALWR